VNGRDPSGTLCERANASSLWEWTKRCSQDIGWFAEAANENLTAPANIVKNAKRAAGGVVSTGKLVAGVGVLVWDVATASLNDAAADRLLVRGQAIGNFAAHPIDTTVSTHTAMVNTVLLCGRYDDEPSCPIWAIDEVIAVDPSVRQCISAPPGTILTRTSKAATWRVMQ
jgi:hypothetical protein